MLNLNQTVIAGVIGNDIDVRYDDSGVAYCRINVGSDDEEKDADGNARKVIDWHRCFIEGDLATKLDEDCQKGTNVYITGKSKSRFFDEGAGMQRQVTELWASQIQVIAGGKPPKIDLDEVLGSRSGGNTEAEDDVPY